MSILAIDVGGSDLKLCTLDDDGVEVTSVTRTPTPRPATPDSVIAAVIDFADHHRPFDRVALGFPGVVIDGVAMNAPNLDEGWDAVPLAARVSDGLGCPVRAANDADVAGLGVLATEPDAGRGVELVITLGTGMGSGLFVDGKLVPNLELGHHPLAQGRTYEQWLGKAGLEELGVDAWRERLLQALGVIRRIFNPQKVYLGGGNARFLTGDQLPDRVRIVGNRPGLIGGASLYR